MKKESVTAVKSAAVKSAAVKVEEMIAASASTAAVIAESAAAAVKELPPPNDTAADNTAAAESAADDDIEIATDANGKQYRRLKAAAQATLDAAVKENNGFRLPLWGYVPCRIEASLNMEDSLFSDSNAPYYFALKRKISQILAENTAFSGKSCEKYSSYIIRYYSGDNLNDIAAAAAAFESGDNIDYNYDSAKFDYPQLADILGGFNLKLSKDKTVKDVTSAAFLRLDNALGRITRYCKNNHWGIVTFAAMIIAYTNNASELSESVAFIGKNYKSYISNLTDTIVIDYFDKYHRLVSKDEAILALANK